MKTESSEVALNEIGQVAVTISDLDQAVAFIVTFWA
jgi:hypothetical protein